MGEVLVFALIAALNPTLLVATTVLLFLPHPGRLMLGYWLGAMFMSLTLGLVIVFALEGTGVVNTTKRTLSPAANFVLAVLMWILAAVLATRRPRRGEGDHKRHKTKREGDNEPPRWQRQLSKGTARTTFVVGALLSLPGATYLAALNRLSKLDYATAVVVLVVVVFNVIQLLIIEIPMIALKVAPTQAPILIQNAKDWGRAHGRQLGAWALGVVGLLFAIKGLVEVL